MFSDEQIVDMVRKRQGQCYPGGTRYGLHRVMVSTDSLQNYLVAEIVGVQNRYDVVRRDVSLTRLRSIAKRGLLAEKRLKRGSMFCTPDLAEEIAVEQGLSDGERAERTAAAVREVYAERKAHYGDKVPLWVATPLGRIPEDGYQAAFDGGLLKKAAGGYVPAECFDAFTEAHTAYLEHQERLRNKTEEYQAEVNRMFPRDHNERVISVSLGQWERIRELLPTPSPGGAEGSTLPA